MRAKRRVSNAASDLQFAAGALGRVVRSSCERRLTCKRGRRGAAGVRRRWQGYETREAGVQCWQGAGARRRRSARLTSRSCLAPRQLRHLLSYCKIEYYQKLSLRVLCIIRCIIVLPPGDPVYYVLYVLCIVYCINTYYVLSYPGLPRPCLLYTSPSPRD